MAIAKWNPFGTQAAAAASETTKPQHVHATPADGKRFGLENVRLSFQTIPQYVRVTKCGVDHLVWQYLVRWYFLICEGLRLIIHSIAMPTLSSKLCISAVRSGNLYSNIQTHPSQYPRSRLRRILLHRYQPRPPPGACPNARPRQNYYPQMAPFIPQSLLYPRLQLHCFPLFVPCSSISPDILQTKAPLLHAPSSRS